jgi:hypothetical protein
MNNETTDVFEPTQDEKATGMIVKNACVEYVTDRLINMRLCSNAVSILGTSRICILGYSRIARIPQKQTND